MERGYYKNNFSTGIPSTIGSPLVLKPISLVSRAGACQNLAALDDTVDILRRMRRRLFALGLVVLSWPAVAGHAAAQRQPAPRIADSVVIQPGDDAQAIVAAAPAGTLFRFAAGVHRMQSVRPRSFDRFAGEPGATLNGAGLITRFERDGDLWTAGGQMQQGRPDGFCRDAPDGRERKACRFPEDLYLGRRAVTPRRATLRGCTRRLVFRLPGDRVYLADDPTGRKVEIGVAPFAFAGGARDVELRGLIIEKYANPSQSAAVHAADEQGRPARGWLLEDNEIRLNHGAGVFVGDSMTVRGNRIVSNGQIGLLGGGAAPSSRTTKSRATTTPDSTLAGRPAGRSSS